MSIHAIGATSPASAFSPLSSPAKKPESAEAPGAPDHDGDSDDRGKAATVNQVGARSVDTYA